MPMYLQRRVLCVIAHAATRPRAAANIRLQWRRIDRKQAQSRRELQQLQWARSWLLLEKDAPWLAFLVRCSFHGGALTSLRSERRPGLGAMGPTAIAVALGSETSATSEFAQPVIHRNQVPGQNNFRSRCRE